MLTRQEVAKALHVSELTIYRLVERGLLPCYRIARRLRFSVADVETYLRGRRAGDHAQRSYGRPQAP